MYLQLLTFNQSTKVVIFVYRSVAPRKAFSSSQNVVPCKMTPAAHTYTQVEDDYISFAVLHHIHGVAPNTIRGTAHIILTAYSPLQNDAG